MLVFHVETESRRIRIESEKCSTTKEAVGMAVDALAAAGYERSEIYSEAVSRAGGIKSALKPQEPAQANVKPITPPSFSPSQRADPLLEGDTDNPDPLKTIPGGKANSGAARKGGDR